MDWNEGESWKEEEEKSKESMEKEREFRKLNKRAIGNSEKEGVEMWRFFQFAFEREYLFSFSHTFYLCFSSFSHNSLFLFIFSHFPQFELNME